MSPMCVFYSGIKNVLGDMMPLILVAALRARGGNRKLSILTVREALLSSGLVNVEEVQRRNLQPKPLGSLWMMLPVGSSSKDLGIEKVER